MKDKVLIVASVASMIDQFFVMNINMLENMGYDVYVAANFKSGSTSSNERLEEFKNELNDRAIKYLHIDFSRNPNNLSKHIQSYKQMKALISDNDFKLIHCTSPIGGMITRLASKNNSSGKILYSAHGFHFYKGASILNWSIYYLLEKFLANHTDCLITTNGEDYTIAKQKFKTDVEFIKGVGIDLKKYTPQKLSEKIKNRKIYGYSEKDFILIFPAELSKRKNQAFLFKVVSKLKSEIPNIKLLLPGVGPLLEVYKSDIKSLGISQHVELLGFRSDLEQLYTCSDLAVSSSTQEGLPVNVMLGMAVGLPCVVTDCRGNRDLIHNGKNGYVVGVDDVNEFVNFINKLYLSSELRSTMSNNNLNYINEYSQVNIMKSTKSIYIKYLQ